jgi:hexosaminidase
MDEKRRLTKQQTPETLQQLVFAHSSTGQPYMTTAPLLIRDEPKWKHRGLSLDIARNPFMPEDVIRTIDGMSSVKMNKLHLHATDSQSWPLDITSMPELASCGAYHPHVVWTSDALERVQRYGIMKGVQVYVEIDMPGHTASIAHSYPELIAGYNQLDWSTFAAEPLSGQLKLNSSSVDDFIERLFDDLLPRIAPYSTLYHLGGDEVNSKVHLLDETVRSDQHEVLQPLVQAFMQRVYNKVLANGMRPLVWEEMILEWDLHFDAIKPLIQAWRSSEHIVALLEKGFPVIFGDSEHWYLDCGFGMFLDPYPEGKSPPGVPYNTSGGIPSRLKEPYLDYCSPYHNWRAMVSETRYLNWSAHADYVSIVCF